MSAQLRRVAVDVTPLWQEPTSPRTIEEPVVADSPDHAAWLAAMDSQPSLEEGRGGLYGRIESEAIRDEPVLVHADDQGWAKVTLPWQPSGKHPQGYPGWVRSAHLAPVNDGSTSTDSVHGGPAEPTQQVEPSPDGLLAEVRSHLGTGYLWGGVSPAGLDCSGLVHHAFRRLGMVVPRDAADQADASQAIQLGKEQAGDLYFFARPGEPIHHVGIVVRPGRMVHAPSTGAQIVEEELGPDRSATLVSAGRFAFA